MGHAPESRRTFDLLLSGDCRLKGARIYLGIKMEIVYWIVVKAVAIESDHLTGMVTD